MLKIMIDERYSIQVADDYILFHGNMTIEEAFDFMNFYEKKGFNEVSIGEENSCLCLMKRDRQEEERSEIKKELDDVVKFHNERIKEFHTEKDDLRRRIVELESLIKTLLNTVNENNHC